MKLTINKIPEDPDFIPELNGWKKVDNPSRWMFILMTSALGLLLISLYFLYLMIFDIEATLFLKNEVLIIPFFLFLVIAHKLIHAFTQPKFGISDKTILVYWPSKFDFSLHYIGVLSKFHYFISTLSPFFVLTVIPMMFYNDHPNIMCLAKLNAMFSCVDLLKCIYIAIHVPNNTLIQNKGLETYYKPI